MDSSIIVALISVIVQGGAVAICFKIIKYMRSKDEMVNRSMNNHLTHTYESDMKLSTSLMELASVIKGCPNNKLYTKEEIKKHIETTRAKDWEI